MSTEENITEILDGINQGEFDEDMEDELKAQIADNIDEYLQADNFTDFPIKWLQDITKKDSVSDDKIITLIKKLIERGKVQEAFLLTYSLKIADNNTEICYEVLSLFKECRLFDLVCKEHAQKTGKAEKEEEKEEENMEEDEDCITSGSSSFVSFVSSHPNQIRVACIPFTVDENRLRSLFKKCGTIPPEGFVIKKNRNHEKYTAFITFNKPESVYMAMKDLNCTKVDGHAIFVTVSDFEANELIKSGEGNLCVHGLDTSIDDSEFYEIFSKHGEVISYRVLKFKGKPLGKGYVQFRNPEIAEKVRKNVFNVKGKPVMIMEYKKDPTTHIKKPTRHDKK